MRGRNCSAPPVVPLLPLPQVQQELPLLVQGQGLEREWAQVSAREWAQEESDDVTAAAAAAAAASARRKQKVWTCSACGKRHTERSTVKCKGGGYACLERCGLVEGRRGRVPKRPYEARG